LNSFKEKETTLSIQKNKFVMFLSVLSVLTAMFTSWYSFSYLLPQGLFFRLLAILPALVNIKSFSSYNLNKAYHNFQKLLELYQQGHINKKSLIIAFVVAILSATGYTAFNYFLFVDGLKSILPQFKNSNSLLPISAIVANSGLFFVTILGRSGSLIIYYFDKNETPLIDNVQQKKCWIKSLIIPSVGLLNVYEFLSTNLGYFTAISLSLAEAKVPVGLNYFVSTVVAIPTSIVDLIFTQREATKNGLQLLPEKNSEQDSLLINRKQKAVNPAKTCCCFWSKGANQFTKNQRESFSNEQAKLSFAKV